MSLPIFKYLTGSLIAAGGYYLRTSFTATCYQDISFENTAF